MDLNITKLANSESSKANDFLSRINSKLILDLSKSQIIGNDEWLDMIEFSVPHLEKALIKQIKQIITEEEIIKIELIKKVTVESVKHLSKNVNFVDHIEPGSGDVIPKKILNAYKEETFLTYENKFLYSLIKLIDDFMYLREKDQQSEYKGKGLTKADYEAEAKLKKEKVKINFAYSSEKQVEANKNEGNTERIRRLKQSVKMLKSTELYQILDSKRFPLVKGTLKMTNVLLKNVHFQYAVKLWNYLNDQLELKNKSAQMDKIHEEKGTSKLLVDENMFLTYLIFKNKEEDKSNNKKKTAIEDQSIRKELTDAMLDKLIELNPEMTDQELKQMIAEKYALIKTRRLTSLKPIEDKFKERIDKYIAKVKVAKLK